MIGPGLLCLPGFYSTRASTAMSEVKPFVPLVVSPVVAAAMLATSKTRLYELLAAGELKSFKDGKLRKIVVKSIEDYIKRKQLGQ